MKNLKNILSTLSLLVALGGSVVAQPVDLARHFDGGKLNDHQKQFAARSLLMNEIKGDVAAFFAEDARRPWKVGMNYLNSKEYRDAARFFAVARDAGMTEANVISRYAQFVANGGDRNLGEDPGNPVLKDFRYLLSLTKRELEERAYEGDEVDLHDEAHYLNKLMDAVSKMWGDDKNLYAWALMGYAMEKRFGDCDLKDEASQYSIAWNRYWDVINCDKETYTADDLRGMAFACACAARLYPFMNEKEETERVKSTLEREFRMFEMASIMGANFAQAWMRDLAHLSENPIRISNQMGKKRLKQS